MIRISIPQNDSAPNRTNINYKQIRRFRIHWAQTPHAYKYPLVLDYERIISRPTKRCRRFLLLVNGARRTDPGARNNPAHKHRSQEVDVERAPTTPRPVTEKSLKLNFSNISALIWTNNKLRRRNGRRRNNPAKKSRAPDYSGGKIPVFWNSGGCSFTGERDQGVCRFEKD